MSGSALSPQVRLAASVAAVTSTLMIAQQIAAKALRDTLFLAHFPVSSLPVLMMVAAGLSLGMVLAMGRLLQRFGPARLVPAMFLFSALLYGGEWLASSSFPRLVAVVVYVHTVTFGASAVSGFWSVINERFDPYVAKRIIGRIGGGATLGGLLGGLAVWQIAPHVALETLLLVLVFVNLGCGALLSRVAARSDEGQKNTRAKSSEAPRESVVATLRGTPYLVHIGAFVLVAALGTSLFDYVFKARASERFPDSEELVTYLALFYTVAGLLTFVAQNTLVRRTLHRWGLAPTIASLPVAVIVFGVGALVVPGFHSASALRGIALTTENSFYRSAYELLYTPLAPSTKRSAKLVIDVGADRLGTALGSGVALTLLAITASGAETFMLVICTVLAAALLGILVRLNRGYVAALAQSMRAGTNNLGEAGEGAVDDETARKALARTVADLDLSLLADSRGDSRASTELPKSPAAHQLRDAIVAYRALRQRGGPEARHPAAATHSSAPPVAEVEDPVVAAVRALRSGNPSEVREVLRQPIADTPELVGHLLPLLGKDDLRDEVESFLERRAPRAIGQLVDALVSRRLDAHTRGRIARLLGRAPTERAVRGLVAALEDKSFPVAHQCAIALVRACKAAPGLAPDRGALFQLVQNELSRSTPERRAYRLPEGFEHSDFHDTANGNVNMQLVHVFTLLAIDLEREPLRLALRSLQDRDDATRGTALEYLENVLPLSIRTALWRHVDTGKALTQRPPHRPELAKELGLALARREISLPELRERYLERDPA